MDIELLNNITSCILPLLAAMGMSLCLILIYRLSRQRNKLYQERNVLYDFVHDVSEAFIQSKDTHVDFLLKRVLFYAQRTSMACAGAIYFAEPDGREFKARAISGPFPPIIAGFDEQFKREESKFSYAQNLVKKQTAFVGEGLVGEVAQSGAPILIEDAERDPRVPRFQNEHFRIRSILLAPMRFQNMIMGVLVVINRIDDAAFIQSDLSLLQALADQASVTIYFAGLSEELAQKRLLDHDLKVAKKIQGSLLPSHIPEIRGIELAAFSAPAREVGGDYYDFIVIDEDHIGLTVADVSGKGVTGAIVMSICRSVFHANAPSSLSPAKVLKTINKVITKDKYEDMFISMLYLVLNIKTFEMKIARAGHMQPFIIRDNGKKAQKIESHGIAMGLTDENIFNSCLEEISIKIEPGDVLAAYTDGIFEFFNSDNTPWSISDLQNTMQASAELDANHIVTHVREKLLSLVNDTEQYDDMTLVIMKRSKEEQEKL